MKKKILALGSFLIVLFILLGIFLPKAKIIAQSTYDYVLWWYYCPGVIETTYPPPDNGEVGWVTCLVEQPTLTPSGVPTLITPTITNTPRPTSTLPPYIWTFTPTVPSQNPTATFTPTSTKTSTLIPTFTNTPVPPTVTNTLTATSTSTATATHTNTPTLTETATSTSTFTPTITSTPVPPPTKIINNNNLYLFDSLTLADIQRAQSVKMIFMDRSVGVNMHDGLNCFASSTWQGSPSNCRVAYIDNSMTTSKAYNDITQAPLEIVFPIGINRDNIGFDLLYQGTWEDIVRVFIQTKFPLYYSQGYRIMSFQFSYATYSPPVNRIENNFFNRNYAGWNIVDLEQLESQYPDVKFFYWTTSLNTTGTNWTKSFNEQMRTYAIENNKYLIDMADLTSHGYYTPECLVNNIPVICRDFTTEVGHLGSVGAGVIKMNKAIWLLMSEITK